MKYIVFLPLLVFNFAIALDSGLCPTPEGDSLIDIDELTNVVDSYKVCDDDRFLKEAKELYNNYSKSQHQSKRKISGKTLKGKKNDLYFLSQMVTGEGRESQQYKTAIKACSTAICVLSKTFGSEESAYRALAISYKSGYFLGLKQKADKTHIWNIQEIRRVSQVIEKMPRTLLNAHSLGKLYSIPDGYRKADDEPGKEAAAWAQYGENKEGEIVYTDYIRGKNPKYPIHVIAHELVHHYDFKGFKNKTAYKSNGISWKSGFGKQNGWSFKRKKKESDWFSYYEEDWSSDSKESCFITEYAKTSIQEDFAETVSYYMNSPEELKKKCPRNYDFLKKNIFANKEYIEPKQHPLEADALAQVDSKCLILGDNTISNTGKGFVYSWMKSGNTIRMFNTERSKIQFKFSDDCSNRLKSYLAEHYEEPENACSTGKDLATISNSIISRTKEKLKKEMTSKIENVFKNGEKLKEACIDQKDIRDACVTDKLTEQIRKLSPSLNHITVAPEYGSSFNFADNYDFNLSDEDMTEVLLTCIMDEYLVYNLKSSSKPDFICNKQIKAHLTKQGYKLGKNLIWTNPSIKKAFGESRFQKTLLSIIGKAQQYPEGCLLKNPICIKKKIAKDLESSIPDKRFRKKVAAKIFQEM